MAARPADLTGTALRGGDYVLKGVIARGGQATVYRAYARSLDTDVAVKMLHPEYASNFGFRERFHDEARRLAQLHHPNLLEVHWYGEEGDLIYIVMRLVPGGTLLGRLQALGGALLLTETARLIAQIAAALQHAHDHDVLHLDVKPANVLLGQADWPLVADLGLTRAIARQASHSQEMRVAGTPAYMSPEQCRGEPLDGRSDQYSLAVTAYEMLTGQRPFQAATTDGLMQLQQHSPPPRPSSVAPGLPTPVEDVLLRGLAKEPNDRFPSIAEFGQALSDAVEHTRGISLETKRAAAGAAPNVLALLGLVLAAPFLLAMLPVGSVFGGLPVAWPFQLLLATAAAVLLFGIRWHVIGLMLRLAGRLPAGRWRRSGQASVEGSINLLYLLATYRLVGAPLLGILATVLSTDTVAIVDGALALAVGVGALLILLRLFRSAGVIPTLVVLGLGWCLALLAPTSQLGSVGISSILWAIPLVVAIAILGLLLTQRGSFGEFIARASADRFGRLLVEASPGITAEQARARREQIGRIARVVLDFGYLLLGYALLRAAVLGMLSPTISGLPATIATSAVALVLWFVLVLRLQWIAGLPGVALGLVLGAPMLLSLPILDASVLQASWPATIATWVAAAILLFVLAAFRGPSQSLAQVALGARLDRGLLGTSAAPTENESARRRSALGRVVTAFLDLLLLLIIYWILGVPLTLAAVEVTHRPELASVVLGAVLLVGLLSVLVAARRAASTLVETSGAAWQPRATGLVALAGAGAALLVGLGAAAPAAVAGPSSLSSAAFSPELSRSADVVTVDWDSWLPWSPGTDQATHLLALSCSNGQPIGEFREAFTPARDAGMPSGAAGPAATTRVPCDQWQQVYNDRRRAAGLPNGPSYSWDWVDVQATLDPDQSVSVVQTARVFFSAGDYSSLSWELGASTTTNIEDVQVAESRAESAAEPLNAQGATSVAAQLSETASGRAIRWSFPSVSGPAVRTFILRYRLRDAGAAEPDRLFQFLVAASARQEPIWNSTVEVHLPTNPGAGQLELTSEGADARSGMRDANTAIFAAQNVAGGIDFTVAVGSRSGVAHAQLPFEPLGPTATPTPTPTLTPERAAPTATPAVPTPTATVPPEPATPTPTQTLVPATATSTQTPQPATATPTATPEPPTATPTATPEPATATPTATPEPATATPTATPEPPTATPTQTPEPATPTPTDTPEPPTPTPTPEPPTPTPTPEPPTPTPTDTPVPLPPAPSAGQTRFGIAEGFRDSAVMADTHADWERIVLSWSDLQPQNPTDFSNLGKTISNSQVQGEISRGVTLTGVFQFTPSWAQANPDQGQRSPPRNLNLPYDDPNNYWGQFVYQTVKFYAGRIDEWVIWNEPEFKPGDAGGGQSYTWQGSDAEFAQLLKVAYLAAKKANPNAVVSFPGTSYWTDQNSGRAQFYERVLRVLVSDPDAPRSGFYHDRVALNLYRTADDVMRVFQLYKAIQARYGLDKPVWLTESNSMPTDDQKLGTCSHAGDSIKTSMQEQAAYAIQAFAMAAASGYERVGFYRMTDGNACTEPAVWGVVRDDGSKRPVEDSLRTAITSLLGFVDAQFVPLTRVTQNWPAWPDDPGSYTPNWQVYQVAFDKPGGQRVTVLWNGDGANAAPDSSGPNAGPQPPGGLMVQIPAHGSGAHAIDKFGQPYPYFSSANGHWIVYLKPATASFSGDPPGYHFIGGDPVLIVEDGVAPRTAVDPPELLTATAGPSDATGPASTSTGGSPDFEIGVNPADGQTIRLGEAADFSIATRGLNGFRAAISLRIVQWSTQRFPQPKPGDSLPLGVSLAASVQPGRGAVLHIETSDANDVGIYYLTLEASGDGVTHTVDVALVVDPAD